MKSTEKDLLYKDGRVTTYDESHTLNVVFGFQRNKIKKTQKFFTILKKGFHELLFR